MKNTSITRRFADVFIGVGLALLALAVYWTTSSSGAYLGWSANLIAQRLGLALDLTPNQPLWKMLAGLLAGVAGDAAIRLNLFSALCGAASVGLLYALVKHTVERSINVTVIDERRAAVAARLAGLVSALALAFSTPFWVVSTRAHTAAFHVLLLLIAIAVLARFGKTGFRRHAFLFAVLYGVGLAEYEAFWPLAPLAVGYFLFVCWREKLARPLFLTAVAGLALLALLATYGGAALRFSRLESYELRGFSGLGPVVWDFWRIQYHLLARGLPRVGWLTIVLFTILPWLICLLVARRALNEEKDWSYYILHVVLAGIAAAILLNVPFSPWSIQPGTGYVRVMPYLLTAMTVGYLAAYGWLLPFGWWPDDRDPRRPVLRGVMCGLLFVPVLALVGFVAVRNYPEADARSGVAVNRYVQEIVESVPERCDWLFTDGVLDDLIAIEADRRGRSLKTLNLRGGQQAYYVRYIAGQMETPRLRNLAGIDLVRLAREWMGSGREAADSIAVMALPDLWVGAGYEPQPHKLVFLAADPGSPLPANAFEAHRRLWDRLEHVWEPLTDAPSYLRPVSGYFRAHAALVVNNFGVTLEDAGRRDEAFQAYAAARAINPYNVSALLNQWVLFQSGQAHEDSDALARDMASLRHAVEEGGLDLWALARRHGYVRAPQAFQVMGWGWALSGQPGAGVAGMKKALELADVEQRSAIRQSLADLHFLSDEDAASEALYFELLVENPDNVRALLGMARVSYRKGELDQAIAYMNRAKDAGADPKILAMEWATLHLATGARDKARIVLEEAVELDPKNMRAWAMLAEIFVREDEPRELARALRPLETQRNTALLVPVLRGEAALNQGDIVEARQQFEMAYAMGNRSQHVLDRLLVLAMTGGEKDQALRHARDLLRADIEHSLANFAMGMAEQERGFPDRAEDFYRRSLIRRRSPVALNNLAMLLQKQGDYAEAETLALEGLALEDKGGVEAHLHDTYGLILMRTGRLAEARQAFEKALASSPPPLVAHIHLAELLLQQGERAVALEMLDKAEQHRAALSPSEQADLDALRQKAAR